MALIEFLLGYTEVGRSFECFFWVYSYYPVSCVQTWYYFFKYRQDVWYIKALVSNYTEIPPVLESYLNS